MNLGDAVAAEYHYKKAIEYSPDVRDWQVGLANALLQQRKHQEAIDVMKALRTNRPAD